MTKIETNCRLEHVALMTYSSVCETLVTFTRDIDLVRSKLSSVQSQDKSLLEAGLAGVCSLVLEEWGGGANSSLNINILIVTDGSMGHGPLSLSHLANVGPVELKLPLPFPCTMSVICLADKTINYNIKQTKNAYNNLFTKLGISNTKASFHSLETGTLSETSTETLFTEVSELHFKQWTGRLMLGAELSVNIQLCPPPKSFSKSKDFSVVSRDLSHNIIIKGYLALSDVASPPVYSRHLVLPLPSQDNISEHEDSKNPNICVFLHGALKVSKA